MFSGSSDIQFQGQVSGGVDNGQQFALLAEATFVDDNDVTQRDPNKFGSDYSNSRLQYFHVFEPGLEVTPKIGVSLDYINTRTNIKNDFALGRWCCCHKSGLHRRILSLSKSWADDRKHGKFQESARL